MNGEKRSDGLVPGTRGGTLLRIGCCLMCAAVIVMSIAAPRASAQSMSPDVLERTKNATVMVKTAWSERSEGDSPLGSGSGFFVNSTGLCVSNDHVTDPGHKKNRVEKRDLWLKYNRLTWTVIVNSGTSDEQVYKADVLYSNDQADMAVMQVYDEDGEFLETPDYLSFRGSEDIPIKTKLWDLGFPGGDRRSSSRDRSPAIAIQTGNVIDFPRSPGGRIKAITTNILANQGNSGGPVVDVEGRLVGIATLASGGDAGRSAVTILIPADLTKEMIKVAFAEQKIPSGVDLTPFLDLLVDVRRVYHIPTLDRKPNHACLTLEEGGGVICGETTDETVTWPTPLGDIEVPRELCAYVLCDEDDEFGTVLLDGGDRFRINLEGTTIAFKPTGGSTYDAPLDDDVQAIAFPLPKRQPQMPSGDVFVIGGSEFNLALKDPHGDVRFETAAGEVKIPVQQVTRIERTEDDEARLYTSFGGKMTGEFVEHSIEGTLAWTGTPITFSFTDVNNAEMRTVNYERLAKRGEMPLAESLSTADNRLIKLATLLDKGDVDEAKPSLEKIVQRDVYNTLSKRKKEEVKRLEGELLLRLGDYDASRSIFKGLRRAETEDVRWHANARCAMLERFSDGKFENGEIRDPDVFEEAAKVLANERVREAKRMIEEIEARLARGLDSAKRTVYLKFVRRAVETEESLLIANRLRGGTTEELLVRLWRDVADLHAIEIARLQIERQEFDKDSDDRRTVSESRRRQLERKRERFAADIEKATEAYQELQRKLSEAGFIIDDSDREITTDG